MEQLLRCQLQDLARLYSASTGVSIRAIGQAALRDNSFYTRLEAGSGFTIRTFDKLLQWFSDHWPADLDWPPGVERPAAAAVAA